MCVWILSDMSDMPCMNLTRLVIPNTDFVAKL